MKVTIDDSNGRPITAEITFDGDSDDQQVITISDIYDDAQIVLHPKQARRLGAALQLLGRVAAREDKELQERIISQ